MTGASDMHTLTLKFLNKCLGQKSQMEKKKSHLKHNILHTI